MKLNFVGGVHMQQYYNLLGLSENCTQSEARSIFMARKKELQKKMLSRDLEESSSASKELGELTNAYKLILNDINEKNRAGSDSEVKTSKDIGDVNISRATIDNDEITSGTTPTTTPVAQTPAGGQSINNQSNKNMMIIFGVILGVLVVGFAGYFLFIKADNTINPIIEPKPNPIAIGTSSSIIPKIEKAKEKHNGDIANIASLINNTINKKGNLKGETELLNSAVRVEQEVLDTLAELRNSSEANTRKGKMLIRILQAEQKRIRGLVDGLRAGVNGLDYQQGFKVGSEGYYEYDRLNSEYMHFETGEFKKQMAYVNGDDVFLRSAPSTGSSVIKTLKRNSGLDAVAIQTCDDERAGMINVDNVIVDYNGQNIKLAKGQPVTITGENGNTYQCQLNLENSSGTIYLDKAKVKKLYGETWYKVQLSDGTEGWVYKDFIQLKRDM